MKKLFVLFILLTLAGCSKFERKLTAKDVIQKYNANVVDNVICTTDLKIENTISQEEDSLNLSTDVHCEISSVSKGNHTKIKIETKVDDLNKNVVIESYSDENQCYLYSDQIGCWVKQDLQENNYEVNTYIDENEVDLTTMVEEDGFYIIKAANLNSQNIWDLIDSITENINFVINWNLDDIEMKLYFNQSDCMLSKLSLDHLECEAEVDGIKQSVSVSLQQEFEFGKQLAAFVKIPDYAISHAMEKINAYNTIYFYGNPFTLPSNEILQMVMDANYHLNEDKEEEGTILFTDPKELFEIELYKFYGYISYLKDIKIHGVKGIILSDLYQRVHIPAGIGGVMVGDLPNRMVEIYGDQYYKTSDEYWDDYQYRIGKDRDSELVIDFCVYKATNEIAKIEIYTY